MFLWTLVFFGGEEKNVGFWDNGEGRLWLVERMRAVILILLY